MRDSERRKSSQRFEVGGCDFNELIDSKKLPAVFIVSYVMYVHGCDDNNVSDDEVFI